MRPTFSFSLSLALRNRLSQLWLPQSIKQCIFNYALCMLSHWNRVVAGQPNWILVWIWIKVKATPQMFTIHSLNDKSCAFHNYYLFIIRNTVLFKSFRTLLKLSDHTLVRILLNHTVCMSIPFSFFSSFLKHFPSSRRPFINIVEK